MAVTVAVPTFAAVATPVEETLTIELFELAQLTDWPVTALPEASVSLAASCCVAPATRLAEPGETDTVLTEPADTVTAALALAPPAEAVMFALPECTAVTMPLEETVATVLLELDHATVWPVTGLPDASVRDADSWRVPEVASVNEDGEIAMLLMPAAETITEACPVTPLTEAVTVAVPTRRAVTTPLVEMVAIVLSEIAHFIDAAGRTLPATSVSVTDSCCVPPATRPTDDGARLTTETPPVVT